MKKPVLFLNFNRPACTAKSFERIRKYKPTRLYISVDAPRSRVASDAENVAAVKQILSRIDWKCDVQRWYAKENLGCRKSVQMSLAQFFEREEEGIILEDDCVPADDFFRYMELMLDRYRDDERIGVIHGHTVGFSSPALKSKQSYFFTQFMNMWGWATWRRTYQLIDSDLSVWKMFDNKDRFLSRLFGFYHQKVDHRWNGYWKYQFSQVAYNQVDTWDYQWIFNLIEKRKYCIAPVVNLVENIGWGNGATHTHNGLSVLGRTPVGKLKLPLLHPECSKIEINSDYEDHIKVVWCGLK